MILSQNRPHDRTLAVRLDRSVQAIQVKRTKLKKKDQGAHDSNEGAFYFCHITIGNSIRIKKALARGFALLRDADQIHRLEYRIRIIIRIVRPL